MKSTAVTPEAAPTLETLLDVAAMSEHMRRTFGSDAGRVVSADLVDHKPGHRALLAYRTTGELFAETIYGKAFSTTAGAARSFDLLTRLTGFSVPRPLGVVPELALVVYAPVPGRSLDTMVGSETFTQGVAGGGQWLAVLHRSALDLPRVLDAGHEADNAASWAELVGDRHPNRAAAAARLARALVADVPQPAGRPVPIHKDFQYQHVIVSDGVGVVDLDEARMGDAAADVAHFSVYLRLLALRTGAPDGTRDGWVRSFRDAYGRDTGRTDDTTLAWYAAYTCMKIAKQLTTGRGPRPRPEGGAREHQLGWALREGLAWLGA